MKRPIDVADIRAGDLIRWEGECDSAREWRSASNATPWSTEAGQHYLLDRPEPAVELPISGDHLGWLTHQGHTTCAAFNFWEFRPRVEDISFGAISRQSIDAWVPATAVPTAALDALRWSWGRMEALTGGNIRDFLADVDEANWTDR